MKLYPGRPLWQQALFPLALLLCLAPPAATPVPAARPPTQEGLPMPPPKGRSS